MIKKIKVLVADDSVFMRRTISNMINSDPALEVIETARDGKDCIEKIEQYKPDIVTLDVEMPNMNGLEALKMIMKKMPLPVIMLSSITEEGAKITLDALDIGALDFIPKNLDNFSFNIVNIKDNLIKKIKSVSRKRPAFADVRERMCAVPKTYTPSERRGNVDIVAIGSSTGGPKALKDILIQLPDNIPAGILIVQHMPPVFIKQFASRLNQVCKIEIKEAENGEIIKPGQVLIAPGGIHTRVVKKNSRKMLIDLVQEPSNVYHRPSVDVMMLSVAQVYSLRALGVIMTGMGNDGMIGMKAIKDRKGFTIAQDEKSCVVYGMPKAAVDAGAADKILPLSGIAQEIINNV